MTDLEEPGQPEVTADVSAEDDGFVVVDAPPQSGFFGFTLRELLIVCVWLVAFVVSFFPLVPASSSVWGNGLHWVLTIGVPTAAVFLIVLRRFSPDGIRRVGSLGIDQFASVAASVAAVIWVQHVWDATSFAIGYGVFPSGWVMWVQLVCALLLVTLTVFAPLLPGLCDDFLERTETLAHRNANPVRPVVPYPTRQHTEPVDTPEQQSTAADADESVDLLPEQPFWALAPDRREVHDVHGAVLFEIGPDAWILVIEDREGTYVVRHDDGRVGYLHDTSHMNRG